MVMAEEEQMTNPEAVAQEKPPDPILQLVNLLKDTLQDSNRNETRDQTPQSAFKSFKAMQPPEFKGSIDPTEAQSWVKEMEKIFKIIKVEEDQKTNFATYMLKGETNFWWESVEALERPNVVSWNRFKELFFEKYFSRSMKTNLEIKFLELKQGNMTVAEYEAKFTDLARFAPHQVDTEKRKAWRFEQGLKPWIYNKVAVLEIDYYADLVHKAVIAERGSEAFQKFKEDKKRKFDKGSGFSNVKRQKNGGFHNSNIQNQEGSNCDINTPVKRQEAECKFCGKMHEGKNV